MSDEPSDLVTIEHAAQAVGRPSGTVRRWTREPEHAPRLPTWPGPVPAGGGNPARLVSLAAVRALATRGTSSTPAVAGAEHQAEHQAEAAATVRADLDAVRAELAHEREAHASTRASLDAERRAHATTLAELAAVRAELAGARDLVGRLDAEREAERGRLLADVERERSERRAERVAHQRAAESLAALAADLDRYGQLGPVGRLLQAPPSPARLAGPVVVSGDDVERGD